MKLHDWEVAAYEIAQLGSCHLGSCLREKAFRNVRNTVNDITCIDLVPNV